jgi:hypothetical protein
LHDAVLQQSGQFSACVLVLLAWDQARRALVDALRWRGVQIRVLVVISEQSAEADTAGEQDVTFLPLGRVAERLSQWR